MNDIDELFESIYPKKKEYKALTKEEQKILNNLSKSNNNGN